MADRDRPSLAALAFWKFLNHLPGRTRQTVPRPSSRPRAAPQELQIPQQRNRFLEPEPEFRQLAPRKRSLSPSPLREDEEDRQLHTEEQLASPLFKLPKEVRLMIYEQVLGGLVLHIIRRKRKLGHKRCKARGDPEQCIDDHCRGFKIPPGFHTGSGNGELIQILQTCRKIYSEAVFTLYSKNAFNFDSLESLVSFSCAVLPRRLNTIRKIQLDFRFNLSILYAECTPYTNWARWERAWLILASMRTLLELQLRLTWPDLSKSSKFSPEELRLLEPVRLVTGLKLFEAIIPTRRNLWMKDGDDLPFQIVTRWSEEGQRKDEISEP